jgi:hypothetical protein
VDAALAPELVAEMLDRVGDVDVVARDPRSLESLVEDLSGRAHERVALDVLAVAGLLTDQHQVRVPGTLAHHRLGGALPQIAGATVVDGLVQALVARPVRNRGGGKVGRRHPLTRLPG